MHRIEKAETRLSAGFEDLHHMRNTLVPFCNIVYAILYFAALGSEIVMGIHHNKSGNLFLIGQFCHVSSSQSQLSRKA